MKNKIGVSIGIVLVATFFGSLLRAAGYFNAHPKITANEVLSQQIQTASTQTLIQTGVSPMTSVVDPGIAARDAMRISDLKQLQNDLQSYYNKCGYYPGVAQPGSSCGSFVFNVSYARMTAALMGSGLGITSVPHDARANIDYFYGVNAAGTSYTLGARLEDPSNNAFQQSPNDRGNGVSCGQAIDVYCVRL